MNIDIISIYAFQSFLSDCGLRSGIDVPQDFNELLTEGSPTSNNFSKTS